MMAVRGHLHTWQLTLTPAGMELPKLYEGTFFVQHFAMPELITSDAAAANLTHRIGRQMVKAMADGDAMQLLTAGITLDDVRPDRWDGFQSSELRELRMQLGMASPLAEVRMNAMRDEIDEVLRARYETGG